MFRKNNLNMIGTSDVSATLTAKAGGGQSGATALTSDINVIGVCATASDSVVLPPALKGSTIFVDNNGAAAVAVWPAGAELMNGANALFSVASAKTAFFVAIADGSWASCLSA